MTRHTLLSTAVAALSIFPFSVSAQVSVGDAYNVDGSFGEASETAQCGVVAHVFEDVDSALVVAMHDVEGTYEWGKFKGLSQIVDQADARADLDGRTNSLLIAQYDIEGEFSAAAAAMDYAAFEGDEGWYLPSAGEWMLILESLGGLHSDGSDISFRSFVTEGGDAQSGIAALNDALVASGADALAAVPAGYWSSSEMKINTKAVILDLSAEYGANVYHELKTTALRVRPVKRVALPEASVVTGVFGQEKTADEDEVVYSLSGVRLRAVPVGMPYVSGGRLHMRK